MASASSATDAPEKAPTKTAAKGPSFLERAAKGRKKAKADEKEVDLEPWLWVQNPLGHEGFEHDPSVLESAAKARKKAMKTDAGKVLRGEVQQASRALKDYMDATLDTIKHDSLKDKFKEGECDKIEKAVQETSDWVKREKPATVGKLAEALAKLELVVEPILLAVYGKRSVHNKGEVDFVLSPEFDEEVSPFNAAAASFLDPAWADNPVHVHGPTDTKADTKTDTKADTKTNIEADVMANKWQPPHGFSPPRFSSSDADTDADSEADSSWL